MPSGEAIVFDTNAYRNVVRRGIDISAVRKAETGAGQSSYASALVLTELLTHLWDGTDPDYPQCRTAVETAHEHCRDAVENFVRLLADPDLLTTQYLYGKSPGQQVNVNQRISGVVRQVHDAKGGSFPDDVIDFCRTLHNHVTATEATFIADMENFVRLIDPTCSGWCPLQNDEAARRRLLLALKKDFTLDRFAEARVHVAQGLLGKTIGSGDMAGMIAAVKERSRVGLELQRAILKRIIETGCDLTKKARENWFWDMRISIAIGEELQGPGGRMVLITDDGAILTAAQEAGLSSHARRLEDHLKSLGM